MPNQLPFPETKDRDYEISNTAGVKIGSIARDHASDSWWILGNVERFRSEPEAFTYWLANYDHETGALRESAPIEHKPPARILGSTLPSYLE